MARATSMRIGLHVTPAQYRAGAHLGPLDEQLAAGTYRKLPGRWRVISRVEGEGLGLMRLFLIDLEPLDAAAQAHAENQCL